MENVHLDKLKERDLKFLMIVLNYSAPRWLTHKQIVPIEKLYEVVAGHRRTNSFASMRASCQ